MTANFKYLRLLNYISIVLALALWCTFFKLYFDLGWNSPKIPLSKLPTLIAIPLFLVFSFIISVKGGQNKGALLFALFLSLFSQNVTMQQLLALEARGINDLVLVISYAITCTVFVKSLLFFPRQLSDADLKFVFSKSKLLVSLLKPMLHKYAWFVFPVFIYASWLFFKLGLGVFIVQIITVFGAGTLFLVVNYKCSSPEEKNKILWLVWGIICYSVLASIQILLNFAAIENNELIMLIFSIVRVVVLSVSIAMSLFFFNTFNTGVLIKRTIVDSTIFILIVIIYNTSEHYFLHWVAHTLHLSSALISSFLSGIFVLAISPLHHKLMHFMDKKFHTEPTQKQNG